MDEELKSTQDIAKATKEIAKTIGSGVDLIRETGKFIARFIQGPLEQASGIVEDRLKYMRWERQIRLERRANTFLNEQGLLEPNRSVPLKIAIPLFQAALLEEDDDLQDRFAKLLVNAANRHSGVSVHRAYVSILEEIGPLEARILDKIHIVPHQLEEKGIWTKYLPERVLTEKPSGENLMPTREVEIVLGNLIRLGCLTSHMAWSGRQIVSCVGLTALGSSFMDACTLKEGPK